MPFEFYAKTYADGGYCHATDNHITRFNNRFLYSGGAGIDVISLYDMSISAEFSFNQLGEKGLFLHARSTF